MNHKSILTLIAAFFSCGLLSSIISSKLYLVFYPENFYALMFAVLVIACIVFFKCDDRMVAKNKRQSFVKIIDRDMFLFKKPAPRGSRSRKSLFLRVSIITMLGAFKRK